MSPHEGLRQVVVTVAVDEVGGASEGVFCIDTLRGVAVVVAAVVVETEAQLGDVTAFGFISFDDASAHIVFV